MKPRSLIIVLMSLVFVFCSSLQKLNASQDIKLRFTGFRDDENSCDVYILDLDPLTGADLRGSVDVKGSVVSFYIDNAFGGDIPEVKILNFSDYLGLPFVESSTKNFEEGERVLRRIDFSFEENTPELAFDVKDNVFYMFNTDKKPGIKTSIWELTGEERVEIFKHLFTAGVLLFCGSGEEQTDLALYEFSSGYMDQTADMSIAMAKAGEQKFHEVKEDVENYIVTKAKNLGTRVTVMSLDSELRYEVPEYVAKELMKETLVGTGKGLYETGEFVVKGTWESIKSIDDLAIGTIAGGASCVSNLYHGEFRGAGQAWSNTSINAGSLVMILWGGKQILNPLKNTASGAANKGIAVLKSAAQNMADDGMPPMAAAVVGGGTRAMGVEGLVEGTAVVGGTSGSGNALGGAVSMFWGGSSGSIDDGFRRRGTDPYDDGDIDPYDNDEGSNLFDDPEDIDPDDLLELLDDDDPDIEGLGMDERLEMAVDDNPEFLGARKRAARVFDDADDLADDIADDGLSLEKPERVTGRVERHINIEVKEVIANTEDTLGFENRYTHYLRMLHRAAILEKDYGRLSSVIRVMGKIKGVKGADPTIVDQTALAMRTATSGGGESVTVLFKDAVLTLKAFKEKLGLTGKSVVKDSVKVTEVDTHIFVKRLVRNESPILEPEVVANGLGEEAISRADDIIGQIRGCF